MNLKSPSLVNLPTLANQRLVIGQLHGAALSWVIYAAAQAAEQLVVVITPDTVRAQQLERELHFFNQEDSLAILTFPDWETLPYDHFSPHADIISDRMTALYKISRLRKGILLVSVSNLMHRLMPQDYLHSHSFILKNGEPFALDLFRERLEKSGYRYVTQVMAHGEYAVRGSLIDVFPMGSPHPYRIDLFGNQIDSLRTFDPETQRTDQIIAEVNLLPAHEFPLTQDAIARFRQGWREHFQGNPTQSALYQSVSRGESAAGIEYYLPLFFAHTETLFDYVSPHSLLVAVADIYAAATNFWTEINERYEQLCHDIKRPILPALELFMPAEKMFARIKEFPQLNLHAEPVAEKNYSYNLPISALPTLAVDHQLAQPLQGLNAWLTATTARVVFSSETAGRREVLEGLLKNLKISPKFYRSWQEFLQDSAPIGIVIAPLEQGFYLQKVTSAGLATTTDVAVITEAELFGQQVMQRRLRKNRGQEADTMVRNLTELTIGAPVVHMDYGVGRYLGLQTIQTVDQDADYLTLEYADGAKLYVPISSLHLISRYSGADVENAPLHRLGSGQWEKAKRKAAEKIRDVAAELLHIYAQRAAKQGYVFTKPDEHYLAFATAFPFEATPDQERTIKQVIEDMTSNRCMDRVVCGDVGFGKTEVAMRAAFLAVQSQQQVALLVPTTLLAEQHLHSFQDRFAKWPIRIEAISRFRSKKEQDKILADVENGKIDILIGTHKLLQPTLKFNSLGLLIVDEEHRFGVRQKDRIKALRAEIDLLTLTATPIPRTLNMAMANIRDLSIIATPPVRRLSIKTFVREYNAALIREAVMRETLRGGQVYFLHNEVQTITRVQQELQVLLPEARSAVAHGQMPERELERIMTDFYHHRFNVLVCTTIIESGIDIPSANTIIINRADRFGLAQLHQLRGRVGRSHHQAYAYLLTPPEELLTADAKKRLTAIESLEDLGSGFILATHDLEIRGAGELLGEEQSGHIQEIGFSLYMELLEETVNALKSGQELSLDKPFGNHTEVDLKIPALIPQTYLPDVHLRLMLYKRIASAKTTATLEDLQVEMIDRFGLLLPPTKNLFRIAELKITAAALKIRKIETNKEFGIIEFMPEPKINMPALITLIQKQPNQYRLLSNEKLRFALTEDTIEAKFKLIEDLLQKLA